MSFTIETEQHNKISLDVNVIREQGKFTTSVYQKPTFGSVYTHFDRFLSNTYKIGMVYTLVNITMFNSQLKLLRENISEKWLSRKFPW